MRIPGFTVGGVVFLLAVIAGMLVACSDSTDPDEELPLDCDNIEGLLAVARESLENKLYQHLRSGAADPDEPSDIDFSAARAHYSEAYECGTNNLEARFGLAICDLLTLSVDPQVNSAFHEWEDYLDIHTPFERSDKSQQRPLASLLGLPSGSAALNIPFDLVGHAVLANAKAMLNGTEPQVASVQGILRDVVLPRVNSAITMLGPVGDSGSFRYMVSPRMQGDEDADDAEIDQADILALRAACKVLAAGIHVAVAYDVQFPSYDEEGLLAGLNRDTGNIMVLGSGGFAYTQAVPDLFLTAVDDLDAGINSLLAETDSQDDDVIKIGPDDVSEADLHEIQDDYLPDVRLAFQSGGVTRTEDWDDDSETDDAPLRIDLYTFFVDPIQNWKLVLPPYTLTATLRPVSTDWESDWGFVGPVSVDVPGDYSGDGRSYYVRYHDYERDSVDQWNMFPDFLAACEDDIAGRLAALDSDPDWAGQATFDYSHWGMLEPGTTQSITIEVLYSEAYGDPLVYVPVVTWEAATFEDWLAQVDNPSLNGLLPDMASGAELCAMFGYTDEQWEPSFVWDWTDMDTDGGAVPPPGH